MLPRPLRVAPCHRRRPTFAGDTPALGFLTRTKTRAVDDGSVAIGYRVSVSKPQSVALVAVAVLVAIQLVPVDRENPPVEEEVPAPPEVREILRRACYDCHSHETRWPWYGYVAPVSWLLAYDIEHAQEHVDFSAWNRYDEKKRRNKLEEIQEEVEGDKMPPWFYRPLHPEADLSEAERHALRQWATPGV
jgi:hypothetical protein